MNIAVVLLNWNGLTYLKQFLPTTIEHSKAACVYVIDNGSTDDSVAYLKQVNGIQLIELDKNYGFAGGYNLGLRQIDAEIYCLMNTDVKVNKDWISPFWEKFNQNPNLAIAQPHLLDFNKPDSFEYAGAAGGYLDMLGYAFCRGRLFECTEKDTGQYDQTAVVHWASGACFFIRKSIFDELGGFDPSFFAHQEEIDLCWRARNMGYEIQSISQVKVWHVGGGTLAPSPLKTYLNYRNSLALLTKNLPSTSLMPKLLFRLVLDGLAGFRFILKGKWSHTGAILKAHFHFYYRFFTYWRARKEIGPKTHNYNFSVVYSYFIKKIKKFSDLPLDSRINL